MTTLFLQFLCCVPSFTMSCCCDSGGLWGDTWRKEKKPWGEDHQDVPLQTSKSLQNKTYSGLCVLFQNTIKIARMRYLNVFCLSFCVDAVTSTRRHSRGFCRSVQGEPRAQPMQRYLQQLPQVRPRPLSPLSPWLFLKQLLANLACCCSVVCLTQDRPRVPECGSVCRLPEQHVLWPVPAVEGAREV